MTNQASIIAKAFKDFQDLKARAEKTVLHQFVLVQPKNVPGALTGIVDAKAAKNAVEADAKIAFANGLNIIALGIQKQLTDHGISDESARKFLGNHVAWLVLTGTTPKTGEKDLHAGMVLDFANKIVIKREIVKLESIKSILTRIANGEHPVFDSENLLDLVPKPELPRGKKPTDPEGSSGPK